MNVDHIIKRHVDAARRIIDESGVAPTVALYLPRGRDHAQAVALGLVDLPREEYTRVVHGVADGLQRAGVTVRWCRSSPRAVMACLRANHLANDASGRAAAFALLATSGK